mgnify:CR=1 FL=1
MEATIKRFQDITQQVVVVYPIVSCLTGMIELWRTLPADEKRSSVCARALEAVQDLQCPAVILNLLRAASEVRPCWEVEPAAVP